MAKIGDWCASWAPRLLSVLRIITAFLFMQHGGMKLFGFPAPMGDVQLFSLIGLAGVLEVFGGFLIVHPVRRDGLRVFHCACEGRILAGAEPWRGGGAVLLHLLVFRLGRRRAMEPGQHRLQEAPLAKCQSENPR